MPGNGFQNTDVQGNLLLGSQSLPTDIALSPPCAGRDRRRFCRISRSVTLVRAGTADGLNGIRVRSMIQIKTNVPVREWPARK